MKASIIIPVWNGSTVISDCLQALYAQNNPALMEVLCVDNASADDSASQITQKYPQVRLLRQAVNLGFAGGVNVGLAAAEGDVLILLNQDCLVLPGWLEELERALQASPEYGILGCTVLNLDDTINHTGAEILLPDASGAHLTDPGNAGSAPAAVRPADFVTGAAFAIQREAYQAIGPLDDDYYPAYYEDADYCYRARQAGYQVGCALAARVRHLFSSQEWRTNATRHTINGHIARYRFVAKQFQETALPAFFAAELAALEQTAYLDQAVGRLVAARFVTRNLAAILARRDREARRASPLPGDRHGDQDAMYQTRLRLLQNGLVQVIQKSQQAIRQLILPLAPPSSGGRQQFEAINQALADIQQRQCDLLQRVDMYGSEPAPASQLQRLKLAVQRLRTSLSGHENSMWVEMAQLSQARADLVNQKLDLLETLLELVEVDDQYP